MKKSFAFTLSETMIVISTLGIIAVLCIPPLMKGHIEKTTVLKVKKTYAALDNAFDVAIMQNGRIENWFSTTTIYNNLKRYLNIKKDCASNDFTCFASFTEYKNIKGGNSYVSRLGAAFNNDPRESYKTV